MIRLLESNSNTPSPPARRRSAARLLFALAWVGLLLSPALSPAPAFAGPCDEAPSQLTSTDTTGQPPVACDDYFEAAPGRWNTLDVLGNDRHPGGALLSIAEASVDDGRVEVAVQPDGSLAFYTDVAQTDFVVTYRVRDARNHQASAQAVVSVGGREARIELSASSGLVPRSIQLSWTGGDPSKVTEIHHGFDQFALARIDSVTTTTFEHSALAPGVHCYLVIQPAIELSSDVICTEIEDDASGPGTISLSLTDVGDGLRLQWTPSAADDAVTGGPEGQPGHLGVSASPFVHQPLAAGETYCYEVQSAAGDLSPRVCATVPEVDLTVTEGPSTLLLDWILTPADATSFQVTRDGALMDTLGGSASSWTDAAPGTGEHCYRVTAQRTAGDVDSAQVCAELGNTAPVPGDDLDMGLISPGTSRLVSATPILQQAANLPVGESICIDRLAATSDAGGKVWRQLIDGTDCVGVKTIGYEAPSMGPDGGTDYVRYWLRDATGNVSSTPGRLEYQVDAASPPTPVISGTCTAPDGVWPYWRCTYDGSASKTSQDGDFPAGTYFTWTFSHDALGDGEFTIERPFDQPVEWDFPGDPGLYRVTLTVTDPDTGMASLSRHQSLGLDDVDMSVAISCYLGQNCRADFVFDKASDPTFEAPAGLPYKYTLNIFNDSVPHNLPISSLEPTIEFQLPAEATYHFTATASPVDLADVGQSSHRFNWPGNGQYRLDVFDDPPEISLLVASCEPDAPTDCTLSALASDDLGIETWDWDLGDGSPARQGTDSGSIRHVYDEFGTYNVTLTVTDGAGQTADAQRVVDVGFAAYDDRVAAYAGEWTRVDPTSNDRVDGAALLWPPISPPIHGEVLQLADGAWAYRPEPGFVGRDEMEYRLGDATHVSAPAKIVLDVVPRRPHASDDFSGSGLDHWDAAYGSVVVSDGRLAVQPAGAQSKIYRRLSAGEWSHAVQFLFDPSDLSLDEGTFEYLWVARFPSIRGVGLALRHSLAGGFELQLAARHDNDVEEATGWVPIGDQPRRLGVEWRAATAPGTYDGSASLWVDGTETARIDGLDNSARHLVNEYFGAFSGSATGVDGTLFLDDIVSWRPEPARHLSHDLFDHDLSLWQTEGSVQTQAGALEVPLPGDGSRSRVIREFGTPLPEWAASLDVDTTDVSMSASDKLFLLVARFADEAALRVRLTPGTDTGIDVQLEARNDDGTSAFSAVTPLPTRARLDVQWWAASAPGASDGGARLWIDGQRVADLKDLDTDARHLVSETLGTVNGAPTGTAGALRIDAYRSWTAAATGTEILDRFEDGTDPWIVTGSVDQGGSWALSGDGGVRITADGEGSYLDESIPAADGYGAEFLLDVRALSGEMLRVFLARDDSVRAAAIQMQPVVSGEGAGEDVQFRVELRDEIGDIVYGPWYQVPKGVHLVTAQWWASSFDDSTSSYAEDAGLRLWIDGRPASSVEGQKVGRILLEHRFGLSNVKPGTTGEIYLDELRTWSFQRSLP